MQGQCERARRWASADLDGELSSFERALLHDHLGRCAECRTFADSVSGFTTALRAAPLEPFEGVVVSRARRRIHAPLAPVAVAMAVVAIGLGSLLASVQLKSSNVVSSHGIHETPAVGGPDALNLLKLVALEHQHSQALSNVPTRAVHGGRVVLEP
ncbi:MAG TPA: zf-HC2 domain-containing protein [Gaiellaceae bacterium]|nr:zf-HC2 domain-containing protein [Gaiellaceae bacterium]